MRYDDAVTKFITFRRLQGKAAQTLKNNRDTLRLLGGSLPEGITVKAIKTSHIEEWIGGMLKLSKSTKRNRIVIASQFFKWAVREGMRADDPTTDVERPRLERSVPRALNDDQVRACFDACKDVRERLILSLTVMEGLRCVEVATVERGDIDWVTGMIRVVGKGGHERKVPLSEDTAGYIKRYEEEHPPPTRNSTLVRMLAGNGRWSESSAMRPAHVSRILSDLCWTAGIKGHNGDGVSAHAFRHTMLTDVYARTKDIRLVQTVAGHASMQTTQIYLSYATDDALKEAVAGRTFRGAPTKPEGLYRCTDCGVLEFRIEGELCECGGVTKPEVRAG